MSLLSKFIKKSALSPINKLADSVAHSLETKLENSVDDLFSKALKSTGISSSVAKELSSRFGDSLKNDLADKYFQSATSEINRIAGVNIFNAITPRYAETTRNNINRLDNDSSLAIDGISNVLQFPNQIGKYYVSMKFREYVRTAPQAGATLNFKNAIILPVPRTLEENFSLDVNSRETGFVGGAVDTIQAAASNGSKDFKLSTSANALTYSFSVSAAEKIAGKNVTDIFGQYIGSVPNPHLATFFSGVNMRSFSFDWTFSPRNEDESLSLQNIIKTLKQNSLPAFSPMGTAVLQYPYLCFIELQPWANNGSELIQYKPALLRGVNINYSPNGIPSFFAGTNLPTFIQISLEFMETEYFTSESFGRSGNDAKGGDKLSQGFDSIHDSLGTAFAGADGLSKSAGDNAINDMQKYIDGLATTGSN